MSKVMIVTGGSRGIGAATTLLAASRGYAVAIGYVRDRKAADEVAHKAREHGVAALPVQVDVAQEAQVAALFDTVDAELGPVTVLVNNAGIVGHQARVDELSLERLTRMFAINVLGSFLCARQAVRRMSTRYGGRGGAIVNVSSVASRLGSPSEFVDYAASKGAIDTFTLGLAREVATEGIRVNAVRPGLIYTDIHGSVDDAGRPERLRPLIPMQRVGEAQEVARSILWLASDEASYVSGTLLDVSGAR